MEDTKQTVTAEIKAAGILSGAYKGKDISQRALLSHAVSTVDVSVGRLVRKAGEAFCNRKLDTADYYSWQDAAQVDCPKCRDILARLGR
jgi:hypothetical protein